MAFKNPKKNKGFAMLATAIVFALASVVIVFGLTTPIIKQILLSQDIWSAKQSYYLSEAGAEDVLYRLKSASFTSYVGSMEPITLNGFGATTTLSGSLSGIDGMTLTTLSNQSGYDKKIQTKVKQGSGVSFTYGVQVGTGGITFNSSGKILGNVFSGGNIVSNNSAAAITGSAIVSDSPSIISDQSNDDPPAPSNQIIFGNAAATQDIAQSFQVSTSSPITQISLYLKKNGAPSNVTVKIVKDSGGSPSGNSSDVIASGPLNSSLVTANYDWVDVALSPNPSLTVGIKYWIVLDGSTGSASIDYIIGANLDTSYALGTSKTGSLGGSWSNTGYDAYFRLYLGGFFGQIIGDGQYNPLHIGTVGTDMAWAHSATYVSVTGPLRCQDELLNNKACDQSYDDPSPASYPVSSGNITAWEAEAAAGGTINGTYEYTDSSTHSLGPKKIVGNLHIGGSVTLNITGTLYVTGSVTIDGSGKVQLASSYGTNSGILVTDGTVTIGGSGKADGDGQTGSYLMIITTSNCAGGSTCGGSYAVSVSGGSGAIVLNAQNGTIDLSGSAAINEATAKQLIIDGNTTITYQNGLANPNFSTGPSGSFNITDWRELSN